MELLVKYLLLGCLFTNIITGLYSGLKKELSVILIAFAVALPLWVVVGFIVSKVAELVIGVAL